MDLTSFRKPALHFSGGKDSMACLYLLRDQLDRIDVYWVNTGDLCPELRATVDQVRAWVPRFHEVKTDVCAWRHTHGTPVDALPSNCTPLGVTYGLSNVRMSGKFDCCFANKMEPMHRRMVADGVDCVIRGTKLCDTGRIPAEGPMGCYTVVLPLRDWSHDDVHSYLQKVGAPVSEIYQYGASGSAVDCLGCTALWGDDKVGYFAGRAPQRLGPYLLTLQTVREELRRHTAQLDRQIERGQLLAAIGG